MTTKPIQTKNLKLVPQTLEEVRAMVEALDPSEKAQVSADWLARLEASTSVDPWTHGFTLVHRDSDIVIGKAGFKGPPGSDGAVGIAYAVAPGYEGNGYATGGGGALAAYVCR